MSMTPRGVATCALVPSMPAIDDRGGAHFGLAVDPESQDAAGEARQPRRNQRIVGVGDEHGRRRRPFEDLGLGVGNRVHRREEAEVRLADVRPHTDIGLGDAHQRADLPGVVHAQLDDRNLRLPPQLDERRRQPDVVVEVPAVADHAVPRLEKLTRHFLRRRLPGAAGDGDDTSSPTPAGPRARAPRSATVVSATSITTGRPAAAAAP